MPPEKHATSRGPSSVASMASGPRSIPRRFAQLSRRPFGAHDSPSLGLQDGHLAEHVGEPQLDEGLARDTNPFRLAVDRGEQAHWKVDIDALNLTSGPPRLRQVQVRGQVAGGIFGW